MEYQFEFRRYRRQFKHPIQTSHGSWEVREGIILCLSDENGGTSCGEIAPISWFGSETLEQALNFCQQLPTKITSETIFSIPTTLPACQFGFESAMDAATQTKSAPANSEQMQDSKTCVSRFYLYSHNFQSPSSLIYSGLLPTGEAALNQWQTLWHQGYRTFKWKIGIAPIEAELKIFHQLIKALPISAQLRLDANGGLNYLQANEWLQTCDRVNAPNCAQPLKLPQQLEGIRIEFLEQPLPVAQFDAMLELSDRYSTQLALDESVSTLEQLKTSYQQGWRGIFVIKPCIAGSPSHLRQFCCEHKIDAVFSSVFETAIGRQAALQLAAELSRHNRAVGFGVNHWFEQEDETYLNHLWKNPY